MTVKDAVDAAKTAPSGIRKTLGAMAAVIAPLTAITALLYYVGWERTRVFFGHFGVNVSQIGFGADDYIIRSGEVGFGVVAWISVGGVLLLGLDKALGVYLTRSVNITATQAIRWGLLAVGAAFTVIGLAGASEHHVLAVISPLAGAALLAVGPSMMARFGAHHLGKGGEILVILFVALAGFWGATIYARDIGRSSAEAIDADPSSLPVVTVFSDKPLDMPGELVAATRTLVGENEWSYRYTGAGLLGYANDRWFLITNPATPDFRSSVVILHESDSIHVETSVPIRK